MKGLQKKIFSGMLLMFLTFILIACGGETEKQQNETAVVDTTATTPSITQGESDGKLNINTASGEAFRTIPGVGDKMVHEFEEYRPYVSIQQFRKEIGKYVDEETVASYEEYIFVPIDPNESDAATLQQIPGLEADEVKQLISGRPYESSEAFAKALSQFVSEDELDIAKTYMKS